MNNEEKILAMLEKMNDTVEKLNTTVEAHGEALTQMQEDITGIKLHLELNVDKQLKLLSEGQANILEHIDDKITERTESLQDQIDVLRAATMQNSREIRALKKAQ